METEGEGFTALEILGALDLKKTDILDQMYGRHPYTEIHHARKIITGDEIIEIVDDQEVSNDKT